MFVCLFFQKSFGKIFLMYFHNFSAKCLDFSQKRLILQDFGKKICQNGKFGFVAPVKQVFCLFVCFFAGGAVWLASCYLKQSIFMHHGKSSITLKLECVIINMFREKAAKIACSSGFLWHVFWPLPQSHKIFPLSIRWGNFWNPCVDNRPYKLKPENSQVCYTELSETEITSYSSTFWTLYNILPISTDTNKQVHRQIWFYPPPPKNHKLEIKKVFSCYFLPHPSGGRT